MEQTDQSLLRGYSFQRLHHDLVMVGGHIGLRVDGGQFVLGGSHFVVLGFGGNSHLPELLVDLLHISRDPLADGSEVMVVQLLTLGRHGAEQGTPGIDQIFAFQIFFTVDQEVLLFRPDGRRHLPGCGVAEQADQTECLFLDRFHGTQKGRLLIQSLSGEGTECRRDTQDGTCGVFPDEYRRSAVPGGIASGFKSGPKAARRERRRVRFSFDQILSGEFLQDGAVCPGRSDKRIMLFGGETGQRLKPVGIMGGAFFDGPFPYGGSYDVCHSRIQFLAAVDGLPELVINTLGKILAHGFVVEYIGSKNIHDGMIVFHRSIILPFLTLTLPLKIHDPSQKYNSYSCVPDKFLFGILHTEKC